jgi:hypothetical protein
MRILPDSNLNEIMGLGAKLHKTPHPLPPPPAHFTVQTAFRRHRGEG